MRILFLHSIGRKKYGGGERWAINAASGLKEAGHHVIVASLKNSVMLEEAKKRGLETAVYNVFSDFNLLQAYMISRFIRKHKIDVVICKGREIFIGSLAAHWGGKPLVIRRTGLPPSPNSKKIIWRTKYLVDGVITNTETIRQIYLDKGFTEPGFIKVIYNGMMFKDDLPAYDFNQQFPGKKIILSVGRAAKQKGYNYLVAALPEIRQQHPDALFFIIGDGKERDQLQAFAREKGVEEMIHFAGYIHEPVPYIKGCDLFLHSALYEGMPNAAMEAMAYGKPVVMTRVNGAEELSNHGQFAVLIPPADSRTISHSVNTALSSIASMSDMASEAMQHIRNNYSISHMTAKIEEYLKERMIIKKNKAAKVH
jgi:glycosyltransferase involved in cell wall biosynthesis